MTNHEAIDKVLASLRRDRAVTPADEALGALALTLAQKLDDDAGLATAAVARELRATLAQLITEEVIIDDDDPIFGTDLPAAVRYRP